MPILIRGDRLLPATRDEVLRAFGYRWTVENEERARSWHKWYGTSPRLLTDAEWLRGLSFHVNRDGTLSGGKWRSAGHHTSAPDPKCTCCKCTLRPRDHANPVPSTATFKCDMCAHGWGACCTKAENPFFRRMTQCAT